MTKAAALPPITADYLHSIPPDFTPFATCEHERWILRTMRRLTDAQRRQFLAHLRTVTTKEASNE